MMSLYAKYIMERTEDYIFETEYGFATYRYLNDKQVYIIDIFVDRDARKNGLAAKLADQICAAAKIVGIKELIGTVNLNCKNANDSIRVLLAYGMTAFSSYDNMIVFKKDI